MKFPEFVMTDIRENSDLTVVSESRRSANQALLQFLINNGHEIGVLMHVERTEDSRGFPIYHDHYTVIGKQERFSAWLEAALDKQEYREKPTVEFVPSFHIQVASKWIESDLRKEVWTHFVSRKYDGEFTRYLPTLRCYDVFPRYFAAVSPALEDNPELKAFKEAGFMAACVTKEQELW